MHVVLEPVWHEREDGAGGNGSAAAPGQMTSEHEHARRGRHDRAQQQQVVYQHRRQPGPEQRGADESFDEHRVGERQRARLRIEDVAVEKRGGSRTQRMRDPAEPPHVEEHVLVLAGARREDQHLRPCEQDGERGEQRRGRQGLAAPLPSCRDREARRRRAGCSIVGRQRSIPISCMSRRALREVASPGLSR